MQALKTTITILAPLLAFSGCQKPPAFNYQDLPVRFYDDGPEGYRRKTTIEEVEKKYLVRDPRLGSKPVVFGWMNKEWNEFKFKMQPGDVLTEFYTPPPPESPHGYAGLEIIRNGKIVDIFVTQT